MTDVVDDLRERGRIDLTANNDKLDENGWCAKLALRVINQSPHYIYDLMHIKEVVRIKFCDVAENRDTGELYLTPYFKEEVFFSNNKAYLKKVSNLVETYLEVGKCEAQNISHMF